ncbi:MAG TPA: hypothetical protein VGO07_01820 [Candidatus Saccharimonadales bacterium]|jgi:hypothetical protein|nr:hypothetical protein [Candidatus Saccharimonadales bacterium]
MHVNLRNAGFGVGITDASAPMLWFGCANAYARHDLQTGVLEITDRLPKHFEQERHPSLLWLDLPVAYLERTLDEVDICARGFAAATRITARTLSIETYGDVELRGVYIGQTCFAKTVRGNVLAQNLVAPVGVDADARYAPTAELISLSGSATVEGGAAVWRIAAQEVAILGAEGPMHITRLAVGQAVPVTL